MNVEQAMKQSKSLRRKGMARLILLLVMLTALAALALLVKDRLVAAVALGTVGLVIGFFVSAPKEQRDQSLLRVALTDPRAGSPKVPGIVVAAVLLLYAAFLIYVALKHHT